MTFATIYLAWSLGRICPLVREYRAQGYSYDQIEQWAYNNGIAKSVIRWAKENCKKD